jgi:hypothetical protein
MFLSEVEELLAVAKVLLPPGAPASGPSELMLLVVVDWGVEQVQELAPVVEPLFQRLAACMASLHFQVAEKALCMWRKKPFVKVHTTRTTRTTHDTRHTFVGLLMSWVVLHGSKVARQYLPRVLPCVWRALEANAGHWHKAVRTLSASLLRELAAMDPALAARCRASPPSPQTSPSSSMTGGGTTRPRRPWAAPPPLLPAARASHSSSSSPSPPPL